MPLRGMDLESVTIVCHCEERSDAAIRIPRPSVRDGENDERDHGTTRTLAFPSGEGAPKGRMRGRFAEQNDGASAP